MMKIPALSLLAPAILALAASMPAQATITVFTTTLNGANEVPVNASAASGSAQVTFDDAASSVLVSVTFSGLTAAASAGHIHCCTATAFTSTAGVALGFPGFPPATSGTYNASPTAYSNSNTFASVLAGAFAGKAYVNIHDSSFPGGEIRGFLVPVPEASTYAMLLAGLGLVGVCVRRRRAA